MKDVKLDFDGYWIDVEDGWLCMGDDENQVLLKPEYFKKLLEAINYTHCCKSDSELLAEHKCKFYVNADWSYLKCDCGKRIKPSEV